MTARIALLCLALCAGSARSDLPDTRSDGIAGGCVLSSSSCRCYGPSGVLLPVSFAQCELVVAPPVGAQLGGGDLRRYERAPLHLPVDPEPLRAPARSLGLGYALDVARSISSSASARGD